MDPREPWLRGSACPQERDIEGPERRRGRSTVASWDGPLGVPGRIRWSQMRVACDDAKPFDISIVEASGAGGFREEHGHGEASRYRPRAGWCASSPRAARGR